ncbi:MAG: hypothetical protein VYA30_14420, partial [Myxococcota bacterium]|nr:hypothetical protein [Myxococcota bacterium]
MIRRPRASQHLAGTVLFLFFAAACSSPEPKGIAKSQPAHVTVKMDFYAKPLPEIPLPNDVATRYDSTSPTKRRINASMVAPTNFEATARELIDNIDGWGVGQPITIPFTGPISVESLIAGHRDIDYDSSNDVIYLVDITAGSPTEGDLIPLDIGEGNYPVTLERSDYWKNDIRDWTLSLYFDEEDEDLNGNGRLDPGEDLNGNGALDPGEDVNENGILDPPEDTDADGILDRPNYLPGLMPARDDLAARADALMYFYERQSNTIIAQPLIPLREQTTYAVLVTRRLKDENGDPVGSPFEYVNHTAQTEALRNLASYLPDGIGLNDLAFVFSFTTQTVESDFVAVRDGLYGRGVQKHLGEDFPPRVDQ